MKRLLIFLLLFGCIDPPSADPDPNSQNSNNDSGTTPETNDVSVDTIRASSILDAMEALWTFEEGFSSHDNAHELTGGMIISPMGKSATPRNRDRRRDTGDR